MSETTSTATITNVGPISHVEIPVTPGTVTVLEGRNGSGKTTALNAVRAAVTGKNTGLSPRDGTKSGSVDFVGVSCRIGMKMTTSGTRAEPVVLLDGGDSIVEFINPGIKNPVAADKRRIEAMLTLAGASISDQEIQEFLEPKIAATLPLGKLRSGSIVDRVTSLKELLQDQALAAEKSVANLRGQIEQLPMRDLPTESEDPDGLLIAYNDAVKVQEALETRLKAAADARARLEQIPLPDVDAIRQEYDTRVSALGTVRDQLEAMRQQVAMLESDLAEEVTRHAVAQQKLMSAEDAVRDRVLLTESIANTVAPEQIEAQQVIVAHAKREYEAAIVARTQGEEIRRQQQERTRLVRSLEETEHNAFVFRKLASVSHTLLAKAVGAIPGWSVSPEMRLCCEHSRGVIPFADLSPGEQAIRVIQFTLRQSKTGGLRIAFLPQEIWESLDGDNRRLVVTYAHENSVAVLSAQSQQERQCPACLLPVACDDLSCPGCDHDLSETAGLHARLFN